MKNLDAVSAPEDVPTKKYVDDLVAAGGGGLTQAAADARYVNVAGDTMTGAITHAESQGDKYGTNRVYHDDTGDMRIESGTDVDMVIKSSGNNGDITIDSNRGVEIIARLSNLTVDASQGQVGIYGPTGIYLSTAASVDVADARIVSLHDPSSDTDAANKRYVDSRAPKITVGTTAPSTPAVNDVWIDTN